MWHAFFWHGWVKYEEYFQYRNEEGLFKENGERTQEAGNWLG